MTGRPLLNSWKKLIKHADEMKTQHMNDLFSTDENRFEKFSIELPNMLLDYSKNLIDSNTKQSLIELAKECELENWRSKMFAGEKINKTEDRAVLHTALRGSVDKNLVLDGQNISQQVDKQLDKMATFVEQVRSGEWLGYSGERITDIVNIGVGGSNLGPQMVTEALKHYSDNCVNVHYVSNVDGAQIVEILRPLEPERVLFIVSSKTFTTTETMTNAKTAVNWLTAASFDEKSVAKHFVAVTSSPDNAVAFGIEAENIFDIWDWVGGRFSLWSAVGLSISLSVGYDNYRALLDGAEEMDLHYKNTDFENNIPVILALLSVWYNNFYEAETEAVLPYSQYLKKLPDYLQQAIMESNGKGIDRNGDAIDYQTGTIVWGSTGTNMQHAFMQLVHQGTKLIPADFIGYKESLYGLTDHHKKLMANYHGQIEALAFGKSKEEVYLELKFSGEEDKIAKLLPFKVFEGNRPSNSILFDKLTPHSLGKLIALYEHKIYTQGILWNIYSYDQFGVELGKELAKKLLNTH